MAANEGKKLSRRTSVSPSHVPWAQNIPRDLSNVNSKKSSSSSQSTSAQHSRPPSLPITTRSLVDRSQQFLPLANWPGEGGWSACWRIYIYQTKPFQIRDFCTLYVYNIQFTFNIYLLKCECRSEAGDYLQRGLCQRKLPF